MLDYEALNKLEKQYGSINLVPEGNPLLHKLRKSAIGNEGDHRHIEVVPSDVEIVEANK